MIFIINILELFTRYRSSVLQKESGVGKGKLSHEAIAFAELVSYTENIRLTDEVTIKLYQVVDLYTSRLEQFGGDISQNRCYRSLLFSVWHIFLDPLRII